MSDPNIIKETVEVAKAIGPIGAFGLNAKIFIAQLINFSLVLLVLWRFAYRPITAMLEARSEKIDKSVKQAEEIEARMKTSETEREEMLKTSRLEAQEIIKKAGEDAEARGKVLADKAREEVTKIVAQGKEQMATERQEMLASVRAEIADLAVLVAEKILEDQVDKKTSEALAKKTLEEAGVSL